MRVESPLTAAEETEGFTAPGRIRIRPYKSACEFSKLTMNDCKISMLPSTSLLLSYHFWLTTIVSPTTPVGKQSPPSSLISDLLSTVFTVQLKHVEVY